MIYLIDDKKLRQSELGWEEERFAKYAKLITPIYDLDDLDRERSSIFMKDNVVLFHESFFDNPKNSSRGNPEVLRQELIDYSYKNEIKLIMFSGSVEARSLDGNLGYASPSNIYTNLGFVLEKASSGIENISINDFLFGINYKKEQSLDIKRQIWELVYRTEENFTLNPKLLGLINQYNKLT